MNLKLLLLKGLVNRHNTMNYDLTFGLDYEVPERRKRRSRARQDPQSPERNADAMAIRLEKDVCAEKQDEQ